MTSILILLADVGVLSWTSRHASSWRMTSRSKAIPWRVHTCHSVRLPSSWSLASEDQASNVLLERLHFDIVWRGRHIELIVVEHVPVERGLLSLRVLRSSPCVVLLLVLNSAFRLFELRLGALVVLVLVLVGHMIV